MSKDVDRVVSEGALCGENVYVLPQLTRGSVGRLGGEFARTMWYGSEIFGCAKNNFFKQKIV